MKIDLRRYFEALAGWEGQPAVELAARWNARQAGAVTAAFARAFHRCRFAATPLAVPASVSIQSCGYRLAAFAGAAIGSHLRGWAIRGCDGSGYPDRKLVRLADGREFALELKATASFRRRDGNRHVLACASGKLRRQFSHPVGHVLLTLIYERRGARIWVRRARLDFLGPETLVDARLEASLSKRTDMGRGLFSWLRISGGRRR
jgi:hypothetical protein